MIRACLRILIIGLVILISFPSPLLAFDNTPPVTSHSLNGTMGSNSWYTTSVEATLTAVDNDGTVASTEYWLDDGAHNSVDYLQGAPTETQFNISSDGDHTLSYFSTNGDGVAESTNVTPSFKIDTSAPSNWRNFTAVEAGNSHTFRMSMTVDDAPSGFDIASAYYNYSVDGINYGYYNNPSSCNSGFVSQNPNLKPYQNGSGWRPVPTISPNLDGSLTVTLSTDNVDFCNSSWSLNEVVQFYIRDLAGNESYRLQLLFGPWGAFEGSIHSQGQINFSTQSTVDYLASSAISPINNIVSSQGWYTHPYSMPLNNMSYNYWYSKLGSPTTGLPGGRLPTLKGVYRVNGNFTIDNGTIPSGLSTAQNFGAVVFINGQLTVNNNFTLHPTSGIVFIVRDNLRTSQSVNSIHGFYIVDDNVDIAYNGNNSAQFVLNGSIVGSGTWRFGKNIGGQNNIGTASERFIYMPGYLANRDLVDYLSNAPNYNWTEVAP